MSLTRRGFLGALAALVAAPAAMLAAKKSAPPIFTKELGVWSGVKIIESPGGTISADEMERKRQALAQWWESRMSAAALRTPLRPVEMGGERYYLMIDQGFTRRLREE